MMGPVPLGFLSLSLRVMNRPTLCRVPLLPLRSAQRVGSRRDTSVAREPREPGEVEWQQNRTEPNEERVRWGDGDTTTEPPSFPSLTVPFGGRWEGWWGNEGLWQGLEWNEKPTWWFTWKQTTLGLEFPPLVVIRSVPLTIHSTPRRRRP